MDKQGALQNLHASIEALLEESRALSAPEAHSPDEEECLEQPETENDVVPYDTLSKAHLIASAQTGEYSSPAAGVYIPVDLSGFSELINPDQFHDKGYDSILAKLIGHVLETESPIQDLLLVQRIVRAHGFQKAGRLIRERILDITEQHHCLREDPIEGCFAWLDHEAPDQWSSYRIHESPDHTRKIEEIAFEEIRTAALLPAEDDPVAEIATLFGVRRLSSSIRERIEGALNLMNKQ